MQWARRNPATALLGCAMAASVLLLVWLTRNLTFLQDTWDLLINRRDPSVDSLLEPHNEHIIVIPAALEQLLIRVFGMSDAIPEYVIQALVLAAAAALLYIYVRRRVGDWLALFAAVLVLFLGSAWEVLLWPFELGFAGSVLFGLAMLVALDRDDRRGDVTAAIFLLLSFGFSSVAIPFAAAAAVNVLQRRRSRGLRRAWLFAVPVAAYGLWYLGWGTDAETHLSVGNVLTSPRFVADSAAAAVNSLTGLGTSPLAGPGDPTWGRPLLVALLVALVYVFARSRPIPAGFWPIAAAAATNWFLTAFNASAGRAPVSSRYQYLGAILVLLLLASLFEGVRLSRRALLGVAALVALALAGNLLQLRDGRDVLMIQSVFTQSDLAAIEIAERTVEPDFWLSDQIAGTTTLVNVQAGSYLEAVEDYGSPAYTPAELAQAPDYGRRQADIILSQALPLSTLTNLGAYRRGSGAENCLELPSGNSPSEGVPLSAGLTRIELAPGPRAEFSLRRFATGEFPVPTEGAPGDSVTVVRVPRDAAPAFPWHLRVDASQPARVCR
jgi:hypothetical protein